MISLILLTIGSLTSPAQASAKYDIHQQTAGLFSGGSGRTKNPRKFVEIYQGVQVETDYAPTVGRHPAPAPGPFVPLHYHSPAELAEPLIVPPAPVYLDDTASSQKSGAPASNKLNSAIPTAVANDISNARREFESLPSTVSANAGVDGTDAGDTAATPPKASGSATGSKATADYDYITAGKKY